MPSNKESKSGELDQSEEKFTPLAGDDLIATLHTRLDEINPRVDSAENAKAETVQWVLSLVEAPPAPVSDEAEDED